jgi:hypothetical protein
MLFIVASLFVTREILHAMAESIIWLCVQYINVCLSSNLNVCMYIVWNVCPLKMKYSVIG